MTQFGKHLLSRGDFKPTYYAFFDDDVLYDSEHAGFAETQNSIESRITETIRTRIQYAYSGIETKINRDIRDSRAEAQSEDSLDSNLPKIKLSQPTADRLHSNSAPLGTSKLGEQKRPIWEIDFLHGEVSGSTTTFVDSLSHVMSIPQVNIDIEYTTSIQDYEPMGHSEDSDVVTILHDHANEEGYEERVPGGSGDSAYEFIFPEGKALVLEEDYLLLDIKEKNGMYNNDEFEMEVFLVEPEFSDGAPTGKDTLLPLSAPRPLLERGYRINNNIMEIVSDNNESISLDDSDGTDQFVEILIDGEIEESLICRLQPKREHRSIFSDKHNCGDVEPSRSRESIYEEDEYEEPCD